MDVTVWVGVLVGVCVLVLVCEGDVVTVRVGDGKTTISAIGLSLSSLKLNTFMITYIYNKILEYKYYYHYDGP